MEVELNTTFGDQPLKIQTGKLAKQASGAVVVQYGETVVLVTAVGSTDERDMGFLPLTVEYMEKIYAAGRIPGNYFRREIGRPSEKETLTARLIDRPIRPLFPKGYRFEIQIIATVLSMDQENDPDCLAMLGASAALEISDIPFAGPIASVRVGRIDGQLVVNPPISKWDQSDLNIIVAGSKTGVVMVEGGAKIIEEADAIEAIYFGHQALQPLIQIQEELKSKCGKPKRSFDPPEPDPDLFRAVAAESSENIRQAIQVPTKIERQVALRQVKSDTALQFEKTHPDREGEVKEIFSDLKKQISRDLVLKENRRMDGRRFD
ncbi:MAG: polyribonucleotide nucleotidyltransferase, partial [Thermodesulfobacteriota bacterium]|nr:polyribonucleotide nucleotidyltransferase [Thermodesulfobacteriota bacterium]